MAWTDHAGRQVQVPEPTASGSHYAAIGDFQGACYARNAFARGTEQEVAFLVAALGLRGGMRLLDAGCGTGRHARDLAARGLEPLGVDVSAGLLREAERLLPGRWVQADARALPLAPGVADAVLCLCQGGFSIGRAGDQLVLAELARVARAGAPVAVTAYSLDFAARFLAPGDAIDLDRGLVHSRAQVRGPDGEEREFDLWSQCYTPAQLGPLGAAAGLCLEEVAIAEPGHYRHNRPGPRDAELLAVYTKH